MPVDACIVNVFTSAKCSWYHDLTSAAQHCCIQEMLNCTYSASHVYSYHTVLDRSKILFAKDLREKLPSKCAYPYPFENMVLIEMSWGVE